MGLLPRKTYAPETSVTLVLANLIPIFGVILYGWKVLDVVIFYWLETIIIGFFNVIKINMCQGKPPENDEEAAKAMGPFFEWAHEQGKKNKAENQTDFNSTKNDLGTAGKTFISVFFLFHYNFFIFVQFFLIMGVISPSSGNMDLFGTLKFIQENTDYLFLGILGIIFSHAFSLYMNFYKGEEYIHTNPGIQMFKPYVRIFIQQFVVILGAMFVLLFNSPMPLLILLVALKIIIDLVAHNISHKNVKRHSF